MTAFKDRSYSTLGTILASSVADAGTTTIAYPSGTSRYDFDNGLAKLSGCYVMLDHGSKIAYGSAGVYVGISFGASNITITNHSGFTWPAGTVVDLFLDVKEGNRRCLVLPVPPLATWTAADIITEMYPGIEGDLEFAELVVTIAVTTGSKLATLNFEIGTTDVTGMTLALTSAAATPKGIVLPFGLPTAGYTLSRSSKLSLEASAVTAFAEGEGYINLYIRDTYQEQY